MKSNKLPILFVIVALLAAALACGGSVSTANIASATMAADPDGADPTTAFTQDAVFYCIVELANAPDDTVVKAVWTAVDVEGEAANTQIDETERTGGDETFNFNLTNDGLWPVGTYKVDLYLNGELNQTLEFEVQ